ncbi:MAG: GC-type dockerin domain-anchored protein [Phycisphaerales bacterium]
MKQVKQILPIAACALGIVAGSVQAAEPTQIGFLWHMHQPRYVPGETVFGADSFFSYSVPDIHNQRFGPYTTWPKDAIDSGSFLSNLGAQVSFSGSLIQNLNELENAGVNGGMWNNWDGAFRSAQSNTTSLGNHRLEMVAFAHHHALLPLLGQRDIEMQIRLYKQIYTQTWQTSFSRGMFPPETAFSSRIIPALVAQGIDWVLVDNIHFDRACQGYPQTNDSGLFAPNKADQINPDPATIGGRWLQLNNLWAPSQVSAPFGYQPHLAQYVDPQTGAMTQITAVPAARYEGNEDGRGGYGAFLYDQVMDAYLPDNTDPQHPMYVVLHHDGDNFGGGSDGYYHHNFQNMVNWVSNDPDYNVSTVNDYLDRFPVDPSDVIHIEDGSWAGADNGDAEFKKWLGGDTSAGAVSPDINSWAVLVAARNHVYTLDDVLNNSVNMGAVLAGSGTPLDRAWHYLLESQASDYWYWDGTEVWDSNVTRGSNLAVAQADSALGSMSFVDSTPPTIFVPQREPYNPGEMEWGPNPESSDFEVWSLIDDYSGVQSATLKWRVDFDGMNPIASIENETYAGGSEVGAWNTQPMTWATVPTPAGVIAATYKAKRYGAMISGQTNVLIDYYVESVDALGNVGKSDIMHVWVGDGTDSGATTVAVSPDPVQAGQSVTVSYTPAGGPLASANQVFMHYGFNGWNPTITPDVQMFDSDNDGVFEVSVPVQGSASAFDLVFNDGGSIWDNNNGQDWHFAVDGSSSGGGFVIDGTLDANAQSIATNNGIELWAGLDGDTLYLACTPAGNGEDRFLVLAEQPGTMQQSMWGKNGQVAAWDAYIGNENDNGWSGWFDAIGTTQLTSGSVLEATIDLAGQFGTIPETISLAVLSYASPDGATLNMTNQVPFTLDGDGNAEPNEFAVVDLCSLSDQGCCPADLTGDGLLNFFDISAFLAAFNANDLSVDFTGDGLLNFFDVSAFLAAFANGCP